MQSLLPGPTGSFPESRGILLQDLPAAGNALLASFDATPEGVCRNPIFTVQHTRFACGSVALGVQVHHAVCDGDGFFQLVRDLAVLYRGFQSSETVPSLVHPPHIRSYMQLLTSNRHCSMQSPPSTDTSSSVTSAALTPSRYPVEGRILHFSSARLNALKAEATDPNGSGWVSTFDALAAHLYQCIHRARLQLSARDSSFGELSRLDLITAVNLRSRLGLPARYFPNKVFAVYATIPADTLANGPLWQVAKVVHDLPRSSFLAQKDEIDRSLKWIAAQPDMRKVSMKSQYGNGSFMISQWNKFDIHSPRSARRSPSILDTELFSAPPTHSLFLAHAWVALGLVSDLSCLLRTGPAVLAFRLSPLRLPLSRFESQSAGTAVPPRARTHTVVLLSVSTGCVAPVASLSFSSPRRLEDTTYRTATASSDVGFNWPRPNLIANNPLVFRKLASHARPGAAVDSLKKLSPSTAMSSISNSVSVISRRTVLCADESSWKALGDPPFSLGPFDQLVSFRPIEAVWVYAQCNPNVELIPLERLQRGLERLLDYYPQLSGRLQINSSNGLREIVRFNTGAELLEARCSRELDAISSPGPSLPESRCILLQDLPAAGNALLASFDATPEGVCRDPILTVQHTRFACGSVALGVQVHHAVCDADGFFQLVRDLAELYRGFQSSETVPSLVHPPHIRSYMSELMSGRNMTSEEQLAALDVQPPFFHAEPPSTDTSSSVTSAALSPPRYPIEGRILRFSSARLNALKAEATDPNSSDWVSTFDALAAYLYQCIHRARLQLSARDSSFGELSRPDLMTAVNLRSRLGLPARYFPNKVFAVYTTIPADTLANGPLWQVAKGVHDLPRSSFLAQKDEIDRNLKWIAAQPDMRKVSRKFQYGNGSFMISQWNKFDMYAGSVFDVAPVLVSRPFTQNALMDGMAYLLPTGEIGTEGDAGAIDVRLSMSAPLWELCRITT
ncbi:Anthranilate N-benzoyltransferase protein 3-like protein [Mycena sanguinolenta]|uniref:Anthranilate N-benzoyltransferase protein 3-like protein n=1 Tax=Mycena sanguinolenta TaxID=230812 RepID=A0A8H6ZBX5_9AGAR|nr:Anthranilate N-benzoyltransferase protein 3-like protein [Mycena sanguinolenta]